MWHEVYETLLIGSTPIGTASQEKMMSCLDCEHIKHYNGLRCGIFVWDAKDIVEPSRITQLISLSRICSRYNPIHKIYSYKHGLEILDRVDKKYQYLTCSDSGYLYVYIDKPVYNYYTDGESGYWNSKYRDKQVGSGYVLPLNMSAQDSLVIRENKDIVKTIRE